MSILLVEDNDAFRPLAHLLLSSLGYQVVAVPNAAEALRVFQASPDTFKLVLTDINLPDMNGLVLAARLLRDSPGLKVLYISADFPDPMPPVVPGQTDRLAKPFALAALQAKLSTLLPVAPGRECGKA